MKTTVPDNHSCAINCSAANLLKRRIRWSSFIPFIFRCPHTTIDGGNSKNIRIVGTISIIDITVLYLITRHGGTTGRATTYSE